jgi:Fe-Mn family superoxide dismutase
MYNPIKSNETYPFQLPALPYPLNALEPHISEKTLSFHHGKHHNAYVTNLNNLIKDNSELNSQTLEDVIFASQGDASKVAIFNNAAQVWNHTFLWHSMKHNGGGTPKGKLLEAINHDFGSFEKMLEAFKAAAVGQFGSGWAWLIVEDNKLKITKTANADLPMIRKQRALLTIDVWEHAYYLDYQNLRPKYVETFFEHLANWEFAEKNFEG